MNVFKASSYENKINVDVIENISSVSKISVNERNCLISEIMNFGQTPSQLFTFEHPRRRFYPQLPFWKAVHTFFSRGEKDSCLLFSLNETNFWIKDMSKLFYSGKAKLVSLKCVSFGSGEKIVLISNKGVFLGLKIASIISLTPNAVDFSSPESVNDPQEEIKSNFFQVEVLFKKRIAFSFARRRGHQKKSLFQKFYLIFASHARLFCP